MPSHVRPRTRPGERTTNTKKAAPPAKHASRSSPFGLRWTGKIKSRAKRELGMLASNDTPNFCAFRFSHGSRGSGSGLASASEFPEVGGHFLNQHPRIRRGGGCENQHSPQFHAGETRACGR
jgi:hypothetical protein